MKDTRAVQLPRVYRSCAAVIISLAAATLTVLCSSCDKNERPPAHPDGQGHHEPGDRRPPCDDKSDGGDQLPHSGCHTDNQCKEWCMRHGKRGGKCNMAEHTCECDN